MSEFLDNAHGVRLRLATPDTGRSSLRCRRTDVGPFAVEEYAIQGELESRPDPLDKVVVAWTTGGRVQSQCQGTSSTGAAGEVTMFSQPDLPFWAQATDARLISVLIDPALVAGVAAGVPKGQAPLPIRFASFAPVDATARRRWQDAVNYVNTALLADDTLAAPLVLGQAGRLLAAATLTAFPSTTPAGSVPSDRNDHQPVLLRRAIEFIEANVASDIALADIADAVCVTPRSVQYMFRRHLDTTPLQYLRQVRLHYAHQDLLDANRSRETVTEIASRWGFMHTGRFSGLYRQTYGQSPVTTLRSEIVA